MVPWCSLQNFYTTAGRDKFQLWLQYAAVILSKFYKGKQFFFGPHQILKLIQF